MAALSPPDDKHSLTGFFLIVFQPFSCSDSEHSRNYIQGRSVAVRLRTASSFSSYVSLVIQILLPKQRIAFAGSLGRR
jgi:hypothetical protein